MASHAELDVQLIGSTTFHPPHGVDFSTDVDGGQALAEFAGRACYETFHKPNPRTATNDAYLRHILEVGHTAVLEHASATLYIRGISRSASHELIRHRHLSFSQLSQRYVHDEAHVVVPPAIAADPELLRLFDQAVDDAHFVWEELLRSLEEDTDPETAANALLRAKQARQAARAVLPNCTESRIVVTGNYRAWRHFIAVRATEHADTEIRALAVRCLEVLRDLAPAVFADFDITALADGSRMASSPYAQDF